MTTDEYKAYLKRTRVLQSLVWVLAINAGVAIIKLIF